MKLLNLACGAVRPQDDQWWNLDMLRPYLAQGTIERRNLDLEPRYVEHDLASDADLPFDENSFDGVLASHLCEHFELHDCIKILRRIWRVLKPGGLIVVSVPDASVFRRNWPEDTIENAQRLYGEPINLGDGEVTFLGYAAFFYQHKMLFTDDSLWCCLIRSGYREPHRLDPRDWFGPHCGNAALEPMHAILNRRAFSLVMGACK